MSTKSNVPQAAVLFIFLFALLLSAIPAQAEKLPRKLRPQALLIGESWSRYGIEFGEHQAVVLRSRAALRRFWQDAPPVDFKHFLVIAVRKQDEGPYSMLWLSGATATRHGIEVHAFDTRYDSPPPQVFIEGFEIFKVPRTPGRVEFQFTVQKNESWDDPVYTKCFSSIEDGPLSQVNCSDQNKN
jgi:hypothetical protein